MVCRVSADAIVLLGCRIEPRGVPSPAARRRSRTAARAFHRGVAARVITSGGRRWFGVAEATALRHELVRLGVPDSAIEEELCSLSTCENAHYAAEALKRIDRARVVVVTCDWHLPRALCCFHRAGLRARGEPAWSPPVGLGRSIRRAVRERVSLALDQLGTFGLRSREDAAW